MADQIATFPAVTRNDQKGLRHGLEGRNPEKLRPATWMPACTRMTGKRHKKKTTLIKGQQMGSEIYFLFFDAQLGTDIVSVKLNGSGGQVA